MKRHTQRSAPPRSARLALATALVLGSLAVTAQAQQADPLAGRQWHLLNTGQAVLGDTLPVAGNDLNVDGLFRNGIRGQGVTIAIVDDGLQIAHPDLAANVAAVAGKNFANQSNNPSPSNPDRDNHGTMVGGIAGAVGSNNLGVRGVASAATLKGFNFLASNAQGNSNSNIEYSWWDGAEVADVGVFNNSWGSSPGNPNLPLAYSQNDITAYEQAMSGTRGGRGGIYVKAAGNNHNNGARSDGTDICSADTKNRNTGCIPAGRDPRNNLFNVITVAAVRADGVRSSYSSTGSALWVSGFGGENGWQRQVVPGQLAIRYDPAILTTDVTGCAQGSNKNTSLRNTLDGDQSAIDSTCNYTGKMNGTSAATPMVSGVAALLLETNPNLSYRDVKYILATTATRNDPNRAAVTHSDGRVLVPGWTVNAAGRAYSNWYGFGVVNAARAVEVAENFQSLGALVDSGWRNTTRTVAIGNTSAAAARLTFQLANGARNIESVQLGFRVNHSNTRQLQFVLVSPSGTRSVVQPAFTAIGSGLNGVQRNFTNWDLLSSNAFLDENATGTWTLEVTDLGQAANAASRGNLEFFKIRVLGH
ncbi:S8 family serine peptidase [Stenotrophomonas geniculata]|jgi:subtilisin family serine protease|uniref:S8 family serine peptidase n=1 Tax=Stenotrophomonas geniculata TaxID=86188 RepID=A0ABW1N1N7_9GAMM|nr:S8 family serine peptidase [Stenotrophomonas geniculata]MCI1066091.1 S8 family serine peptidase [Stenotrophomonas maltophilia]MCI1090292.1 S8 family serine peptidase [Stenotrophomonas maltophilia]MCI1107211.1 S8 family serine peptidase [Stenotrophomonas maltophilia]MCI1127045.1 S8 family serine peptidase [Stenotrophomonas maltophilia]MCU1019613.1 S8 family serine peptidase [Stenotrophomonas maltophilia]